ncbi:molybdopterin molybdotransferase MoeA [Nonomuraea candida]|uniref:molybdopterin molybdotransferase MoeA n=1 Tax=Nonomuraea candida TaxID=359159 RepID=UPI0005BAC695|nr:molybdopterin molybdotransferase MoeA [Nonomuraea candida]
MTVLRHGSVVEAISWGSARARAAGAARPLRPSSVPLPEALGCRLAGPLRALAAVPGVDVSAMDGYAVAGPGPWRLVGRVLAGGAPHAGPLGAGEAVEIATGAPVPDGAEAVLPYERAEPAGEWVAGAFEKGRHIRRRGEDIPEGTFVLGAGAVVTPVVLGLAAALGHDTLPVRPRPRVTVLVTGDEVVHEGLPGPGRVRDAIGPFLPGLVDWAGGRVTGTLRLPDGPEPLRAALAGPSLEAVDDVIVVCGASSKGPADHLRAVLDELGADVLIDGVAVRPGHPQLLARLPGGGLVVGLPGNPFAALAAALTLLAPILRELTGTPAAKETSALAGPVRTHPRDTRLVPVRRSARGAVPVGHDRPGSLWGAALAEALAVVPPGWRGEQVELIELPAGG